MCMLSVVTGYGHQRWPYTVSPNTVPPITQVPLPNFPPPTITYTKPEPTEQEWKDFRKLVKKARKWDELMGEPDCVDHEKDQWMKDMKKLMKRKKKLNKS